MTKRCTIFAYNPLADTLDSNDAFRVISIVDLDKTSNKMLRSETSNQELVFSALIIAGGIYADAANHYEENGGFL